MRNCADKILQKVGFSEIPTEFQGRRFDDGDVHTWLEGVDFDKAADYYGLKKHDEFMSRFGAYMEVFYNNRDLQAAAYLLNRFLFCGGYGWPDFFARPATDMLSAVVLLSGWQQHTANMVRRRFDEVQVERHRHRIFECCTIGLDVYGIDGVELSQLIWGSIFINAHIVELGRLQYELKRYAYRLPSFQPEQEFCIGIHIPRGEKLDDSLVENSIKCAKRLIPKYFSEFGAPPVYLIHSWLLAEELEDFLPVESNIACFRRRFRLLGASPHSSIAKFLFNSVSAPLADYPEDTSLQREVKRALLQGRRFYDGIGVLR